MPRDFQINGPALVLVKGAGALLDDEGNSVVHELGLSIDRIRILPRLIHRDLTVDDYGAGVPAEVLTNLAEAQIHMTLIHYDRAILKACIAECHASSVDGTMTGAMIPLGGGRPLFSVGNHYISLSITSPSLGDPWRFPTAYLYTQPMEIPVGTEKTMVQLKWRAIPYKAPASSLLSFSGAVPTGFGEIKSNGGVVWDHEEDVDT